jgi:hypothetical protein
VFDSIGWFEIFFILIVGLIIIGPEKLPGVIEDIRAGIYAARRAIDNAKKELNGELDNFGAEFRDLQEPLSQIASFKNMGPKAALTKALFDGDSSYLDDFDPKKPLRENKTQPKPQPEPQPEQPPQQRDFNWDDVT